MMLFDQLLQSLCQTVAHSPGFLAGIGSLDLAQRVISCHAGNRRRRQRSSAHGFGHFLSGRVEPCAQVCHTVVMAADSACSRISSRNNLSENCKIRIHVKIALRASRPDAESGHHFVKNQKRPVFMRQIFRAFDKTFGYRPGPALRPHRLDIDGCRASGQTVSLEFPLQIFQVIREELVCMPEYEPGYSLGHKSFRARHTDAVCQLVRPAVVSPAHLQDILFPGLQSGDPGRAHACLGAGSQHTELLYRRNHLRDLLRQFIFIFMEQTRGRTAGIQKIDDPFPHFRRIAAQDRGAARLQQVIIPVPVDIVELRSLRFIDHDGERVVERQIVLHPSGDHLFGFLDHLF